MDDVHQRDLSDHSCYAYKLYFVPFLFPFAFMIVGLINRIFICVLLVYYIVYFSVSIDATSSFIFLFHRHIDIDFLLVYYT